MKAIDLMVGDWVNYKSPSSGKLQPVKIKNIYGVEFNCEVEYWNIKSGYSISDTEPIKLTDEILTKNGWFALDEYRYEGDVALAKESSGFRLKNTNICVNYVHQLQHLLRLSGINKEIEL